MRGSAPELVALWPTQGKLEVCLSRAGFTEGIHQPGQERVSLKPYPPLLQPASEEVQMVEQNPI